MVVAVNEQTHFDDPLLNGWMLVLTFSTGLVDAARFLAIGHVVTVNMAATSRLWRSQRNSEDFRT
jgi:hypothetical protein